MKNLDLKRFPKVVLRINKDSFTHPRKGIQSMGTRIVEVHCFLIKRETHQQDSLKIDLRF
jgi:hypothetical protein